MRRTLYVSSVSALVALLSLGAGVGCDQSGDDVVDTQRAALVAACHLDDGTVEHDADIRACEPGNTKKTTICHIPPGNPGNAHTLCIGNPAVAPHLQHHGDYLGPCKDEVPCPPASPGAGGHSGQAGHDGHPDGTPPEGTGGTPVPNPIP
jgi:hypothetical protein